LYRKPMETFSSANNAVHTHVVHTLSGNIHTANAQLDKQCCAQPYRTHTHNQITKQTMLCTPILRRRFTQSMLWTPCSVHAVTEQHILTQSTHNLHKHGCAHPYP